MGTQLHPHRSAVLAMFVAAFVCQARAEFSFSINLKTGVSDPIPASLAPFVSFESSLADANRDGYFEAVLRINLNDPAIGNPFSTAVFQIFYDAIPTGMSVNIGDSRTNNGFRGDGATQSNDAEINIGAVPPTGNVADVYVWGNDSAPVNGLLRQISSFIANAGAVASLTVSDQSFAWNNNQASVGSLVSPYLFALSGQSDSEGPINYNIYAAFNESIDGVYRPGTGVARVIVSMVPEPATWSVMLAGLGIVGFISRRRR